MKKENTVKNYSRMDFGNDHSTSVIEEETTSSYLSQMDKQYDGEENSSEEDHVHFRLFNIGGPNSRARYKRWQASCYNFLERPCSVFSLSYHFVIFALVVFGLILAILETMEELETPSLKQGIYVLEIFLLLIFTLEYILRMWSAGCRSTYVGLLGRLRFAVKPFVIVDIIVVVSTTAVILTSVANRNSPAISILKFFQVLRMIRFDRQGGTWKLLGSVLFLHRQELLTTFYIGFCSLIFASFFVYLAEKEGNATDFGTFADSFWWGVVTLTTVGYGDKVPISWAGRGIASFFAIMGISFFALPAGILGSGFALKVSQQQKQKQAKRRRRPAAMLIQCNWRYYASRKNSQCIATWLPYIRYIQATNARKEEVKEIRNNHTEKSSHPSSRTRKISLFGRKSSDTLSKPDSSALFNDHCRSARKKMVENNQFASNDSLQNFSTCDQHTDDEHGGNSGHRKLIAVTDSDGKLSLHPAYKQGIRFTRYLKFLVALRKFKLAKRPYDVKDVIEQYNTGHVELLGKVKGIGYKIDHALGYKIGTEKIEENPCNNKTNVVHRLSKLEKQVKTLDLKMDRLISLLENSTKNECPVVRTSEEEDILCPCEQIYTNNEKPEDPPRTSEDLKKYGLYKKVRKYGQYNYNPIVRKSNVDNDEKLGSNGDDVKIGVTCLTTEDDDQDLAGAQSHPINEYYRDSTTNKRPGVLDDKYLSPKPFGCDSYDLRSRSDSAISSVGSEHKKHDGHDHPVKLSPGSSDSEDTAVQTGVTQQMNDMSSSDTLAPLPWRGAGPLEETSM